MTSDIAAATQCLMGLEALPVFREKDGGRCVLVRVALPPYPLSNVVAGLVSVSSVEQSVRAI
jgi:hypothetical protein